MKDNKLTIALIQMSSELANVTGNVAHAVEFIKTASQSGAEIVCFPEMFTTGYSLELFNKLEMLAEDTDGPSITTLRIAAKENNVYVIAPFICKNALGNPYNAAAFINPRGEICCTYSKIHMFGKEKDYFEAGMKYQVINIGKCKVGILICYDMNFPETFRANALMGADVVFVCSAWRVQDKFIWENLPTTRALDNGVYVAAVNAFNKFENLHLFGGSRVTSPWGKMLSFGGDDRESMTIATLDIKEVNRYRQQSGILSARKPETYEIICRTI